MSVRATADVIVIGAGFAGGFTAHAFAKRGAKVLILESGSAIATKASGNRFALLTPYITTKPSTLETTYSAGFHFSYSLLTHHAKLAGMLHRSGALQLPATDRLVASLRSTEPIMGELGVTRISAKDASEHAGITISSDAFHAPTAGFIDPRGVLTALLDDLSALITVEIDSHVASLTYEKPLWEARCSRGLRYVAPTVVICNAYEASSLGQSSWLPLEPVRGQTVSANAMPGSRELRTIISFGGYITPALNNSYFIGAHYRHNDATQVVSEEDTLEILRKCSECLSTLRFASTNTHDARVCFRTSTFDRLPYIGQLPDFALMKNEARSFQPGTDLVKRVPITHYPGLFANVGHGSRGLLSCPMGGEILARLATDEALQELETVANLTTLNRLPYRVIS